MPNQNIVEQIKSSPSMTKVNVIKIALLIWIVIVLGGQGFWYLCYKLDYPFQFWNFPIIFSGLAFFPTLVIGPSSTYLEFIIPYIVQLLIFFFSLRWYITKFDSSKSIKILWASIVIFFIATSWLNYEMLDFIDNA
ncbi:MAG: hypothetical protein COA79_26490 [Planctomycetota bacterium]|nr:MAG: hypothetical protein COA79_26490 [Planctomycetota bacterium]